MSSLTGVAKFFCKLISESVRFILFFASIVFLVLSLWLLFISAENRYAYSVINLEQCDYYFIAIKAMAIYLIVLSLFGIHGSFFRNETSMNLFAFLASLNILLGYGVFAYASPRLDDSTIEVSRLLKELQPNYDWFAERNVSAITAEATKKWNDIQLHHECCGIHSPKDWDSFKPSAYAGAYPLTCCQSLDNDDDDADDQKASLVQEAKANGSEPTGASSPAAPGAKTKKVCGEKERVWSDGCVDKINGVNELIRLSLLALIIMNLILSVMAGVVLIFHHKPGYQSY